MSKLLAIAQTELRIYLMDRGNLFGLVAMPIIMTLLLGGVFSGDGPDYIRMDLLDEDNSPQSEQFINDLRAVNPALLICPLDQDADDNCQLGESALLCPTG
jgi:hypothetical protein